MQLITTEAVAESNAAARSEARTVVDPDTTDSSANVVRFGYALDREAETWDAIDGATREDAARAAFAAEQFVDVIFICERRPIDKLRAFQLALHGELLIVDADIAAGEQLCPCFDGSIFAADRPAIDALEACILAACAVWLRAHPGPDVWEADNVTTHRRADVAWVDPGPFASEGKHA